MHTFHFSGKVWRYQGDGPWHFVYVKKDLSQKIRDIARTEMQKRGKKKGFQFVRVMASVGKTSWQTSLFPTKDGPYLLALKAEVRRKEGISDGDEVKVVCSLL